ncbi:hypothetical protein NBRC116584_35170 [Hydrogenophaga sp. 5NK40-0174]
MQGKPVEQPVKRDSIDIDAASTQFAENLSVAESLTLASEEKAQHGSGGQGSAQPCIAQARNHGGGKGANTGGFAS